MNLQRNGIYITVFISSLAIMFLQLLAGRIVAPYLGQNLFTWSGIIATTLAGIAIGNYLGGRIADRYRAINSIPLQFLIVALCILIIFPLNRVLGEANFLKNLQWEWRIFTHILLLFIPAFTALGTISPVLTRLLVSISPAEGTSVGIFYFASLLGSLVGTFLTGFYLIPMMSYPILVGISIALLMMISLVYGVVRFLVPSDSKVLSFEEGSDIKRERKALASVEGIPFWKLLMASFWAGAGIMIVEIVAGRILAKNFGNSLYTWTSNIGVILAGLSIGGYFGGYLSEHYNVRKVLTIFWFGSSISVLLIPLVSVLCTTIPFLWNLSWSSQILLSTIIIFGVASVFFGALPPALVKLTSGGSENERGKRIGLLYAMNAIGGVLGVIFTAYIAIANLGSALTLVLVAFLSAGFFIWFSKRSMYAYIYPGLVLILFLSAMAPRYPWDSLALQLALKPYRAENVVYEKESQYNYILVKIADVERPYVLDLVLDKMIHNRKNLKEPLKLLYPYEFLLDAIVSQFDNKYSKLSKALLLGGGGYTFCHYLEHTYPSAQIEVAEIDKEVTKTAFGVLGLPRDTKLKIYNQDARNRVDDVLKEKASNPNFEYYDVIINDTFSDYSVPFHLTTKEFEEKVKSILSPKGLYLCNITDSLAVGGLLSSMVRTYREVFPHIYVFRTQKDINCRDTFVLVASNVEIDKNEVVRYVKQKYMYDVYPLEEDELEQLLERNKAVILTDSYAPVENLLAPMVSLTEDTPYLRRLAKIARKMEQDENYSAINDITQIIQERPNLNDGYFLLLEALYREGRYAELVAWSKKTIERMPSFPKGYVYLGNAYLNLGNIKSAIEACSKALELDPNLENVKVNLSTLYIQQKELQKAETLLSNVEQFSPKIKPSALMNLATLRYLQGNYNEALANLLEVEKLQPKNYDIKRQMAIVYLKLGDKEKAREKVMECLKNNVVVEKEIIESVGLTPIK